MQTISINQNNDIYIDTSGNIAIKNDIEALADISKNKVLTTLGEPEYNQLEGIPYFDTIFCDNPKIDLFQAAIIQTLKDTENVYKQVIEVERQAEILSQEEKEREDVKEYQE